MKTVDNNKTLILGIGIPILTILLVVASIYLPRFFITQPSVNFLYLVGSDQYYCGQVNDYIVQDGQVVRSGYERVEAEDYHISCQNEIIYIYDVVKNESRQIAFEEAQKLKVDSYSISPDGYEIVFGETGYGVFPFSSFNNLNYRTRYLKGHNISKKINIHPNDTYYGFHFLGWIIK